MAPRRKAEQQKRVVRVIQVDTRDPYEALQGPMRTWPGGASHGEMQHRYFASNPMPPRRPYWSVTAVTNAAQARHMGWVYEYAKVPDPPGRHPSWVKIRHVLHCWDTYAEGDVVVVLDTDAWVRDADGFQHLVDTRLTGSTLYLASAEPACNETSSVSADVMNGGFMCFRKEDSVRKFLQAVWDMPESPDCQQFLTGWPWEQACLARAFRADVAGCSQWTEVLPVTMCNTPAGTHVTHCWYKDAVYDLAVDDLLSVLGSQLLSVKRPTLEIVVAKYQEDVSWINEWVPFVDKVTIYDKSTDPVKSPHPKVSVVQLPNVGREGHTYAHHFVEHYDDLCDNVVCTQGKYDDHLSRADFEALVRGREQPAANGLDIPWSSSPMKHFGWTVEHNFQTATMQPMQPCEMTMAKYFLTHVADDIVPEAELRWWFGAIFNAVATNVRRHPRSKYEGIRDSLAVGNNPEAAHMMERFWRALLVPKNY